MVENEDPYDKKGYALPIFSLVRAQIENYQLYPMDYVFLFDRKSIWEIPCPK